MLFFTQKGPFAFFLLFWHEKENKKRKRQQTFDNFDKKKSSWEMNDLQKKKTAMLCFSLLDSALHISNIPALNLHFTLFTADSAWPFAQGRLLWIILISVLKLS